MQRQPSLTRKPILAIVSHTLRRDLEEPLRHFRRLRIVHLYHQASYGDMRSVDFASQPIRFVSHRDLGRRLRDLAPTIVQGPEPYASRFALRCAWIVEAFCRRTRTPFFFPVFENRPPRVKFGPIVGWLMERTLGRYARAAAGTIALNEGAVRNLVAAGVPKARIARLSWGTWGVDTTAFRPNENRRSPRPIVLFVGRISAAKGLAEVLDAWSQIHTAFPTAQLLVGGPKIERDSAELLANLERLTATEYLGPIKHAELPRLFQQAWLTLAPSVTTKTWEEQVGMINLQSLACATPVVTTRSGAIPEYVGEDNGATLVPERDPEALAVAAIKLLGDAKQRRRAGKRGRAHVVRYHEVRKSVRRCEEYVLDLLGRSTNDQ